MFRPNHNAGDSVCRRVGAFYGFRPGTGGPGLNPGSCHRPVRGKRADTVVTVRNVTRA